MRISEAISSQAQARHIKVLQPYNLSKSSKRQISQFDTQSSRHLRKRLCSDGRNEEDLLHEFYELALARGEGFGEFYDLRTIFDQHLDEIYIDQVHCSDLGNQMIADRLASIIASKG